jgi:hypothetical protein
VSPRQGLLALAVAALSFLACPSANEAGSGIGSVPPAPGGLGEGGLDRSETLGPFLAEHWSLPIPAQATGASNALGLETDLDPRACGACHPKQFAEWQGTLHAGAFSPGFAGQLIEGKLAKARSLRHCQTCHNPLAEQQPVLVDGTPSPHFDPALRRQGLVCAACHVRNQVRYGPPRQAGLLPTPEPLPHDGFVAREEFEESRFCAQCHQFFGQQGPSGRPIENTFVEWQASPHAAAGWTCQSCHMPDRAHSWRGIHDEETVRGATRVEFSVAPAEGERISAELVLESVGVGHMLPSYVTPRIFLLIAQTDASGEILPATEETFEIGRRVNSHTNEDVFDTRIPPGEAATLRYAHPRNRRAAGLVGRVTVHPDFHYRRVFASLTKRLKDPEALRLIHEALEDATDSVYVLEEVHRPL